MTEFNAWPHDRLDLLSAEDEHRMAVEYQRTRDPRLEERLVRSQLRLVTHLARKLRTAERDCEDLVQEGALGLLTAVRRFEPDRSVRLSSYAALWIRAYQLRWLMANHRLVKVGSSREERRLFWNLRSTASRLASAGIDPTTTELAHALDADEADVSQMSARLFGGDRSLDAPTGERSRLSDRLAARDAGPDVQTEQHELEEIVRAEASELRSTLALRDRSIFDARFSEDAVPLSSLGERFGITRERTRQLEARTMTELRRRVARRVAA